MMSHSHGTIQCPACHLAMTRQPGVPIEIERCATCDSFWFDAGELQAYLRKRLARSRLRVTLSGGGTSTATYLCPRCPGTHLRKRKVQSVTVHACRACRGVLVPTGQVHLITQRFSAKSPSRAALVWDIAEAIGQLFIEIGS